MDVLLTMRAFRRVVERNSFYKAAEDLAITPAALSKQIKQLESRLGTLLLVRTTRSMSLTEAGQLYYQEACRLLGEFDALEQTVAASAQQVSGTLRVNAPLSFGLTVLSPLLPPFMQRYPQLQVELTLDDRVLDVVAAGFDISLRIRRRLPDSSLSAGHWVKCTSEFAPHPAIWRSTACRKRRMTCRVTAVWPIPWRKGRGSGSSPPARRA